ncbi:MAG: hypothetical protein ACTSQI_00055 [Candidatus Helarchaeota archaeon]
MSQVVSCPKCGRRFSPLYSRAVACGDCPSASLGDCGMIKCPYCHQEFSVGRNPYATRLI